MKSGAVLLVLLLSSLMLAAQQGLSANEPVVIIKGGARGNCPIGMHASQGVWDHTLRVHEGESKTTRQPFGQRIFLVLKDANSAPIVSARVKVRGLTGKNRMVQAGSVSNTSGDGIQLMTVGFVKNQNGDVLGDLHVAGFTSVSSIELIEISYSDGKVWRVDGTGVCRVQPDGMMLIANQ